MEHHSRLVGNASAFGASALGGLLLVGCTALWNPVQREGLDADVRALLRGAGVTPAQLD